MGTAKGISWPKGEHRKYRIISLRLHSFQHCDVKIYVCHVLVQLLLAL